ncbi:hypothetical protein G7067_12610 [Leucobacter insecticola]|uniref:Surface-anchored protein n=1 Tax=Leucobacter insecticola TaxID=2714934 RepID=A0A6G8FKT8_9MICO|nr:choice-of-anchor M domain-containing protein [Leucobacter insecticola]QIM17056.1 hypothetical protein G7067_12610 [Leucobacter insecticola]
MEGPGDVVVYLQSGNFGDPEPLWSSLESFPQQSWIEVNTHTHANWVFSAPGIYLVDIQFDAELNTGEAVTAQGTLRFAVGDATDPAPAFTMTSQPHDTSAQDGDTAKAQDGSIAEPEAGANTLAIVVWCVVGVIALALIAAVIIAMAASRRAKARAFAAREPQTDLPNPIEKADTV